MPSIPAAYAPNDYEVAHARRVLERHAKATGAKQPTKVKPKPAAATRVTAARREAVHRGRFDHLKPAAIIEAPVAVQIASPSVRRAEKAAADRRDHADLHHFGHVRSEAERRAEDARADRFAREAVALVEGRR